MNWIDFTADSIGKVAENKVIIVTITAKITLCSYVSYKRNRDM